MNKKTKVTMFWTDPVWSKVIASLIILIFGISLSIVKGWWAIIGRFTVAVLFWFTSSSMVANWFFALLLLCGVIIFVLLSIIMWIAFSKNNEDSNWRSYVTDEFFRIRWRWRYSTNGAVQNMHAFCPECDYQVFPRNDIYYSIAPRIAFKCDDCGKNIGEFEMPYEEMESRVERLIQKSIRTGAWQRSGSLPK